MRRLTIVFALLAAVAAIAACTAGAAPGWTYAPPSASPAASGSASASPGASASAPASVAPSASVAQSAEPSQTAGASPSAGASGGTGTTLTITAPSGAATSGFDPATLEAAADTAFSITFDNQDTTTGPHNFTLKDPNGAKVEIGDTSFFQGPAQKTYQIPALAAGDYPFVCEVHPTVMKGTLTIK
jgi:plastocyanin